MLEMTDEQNQSRGLSRRQFLRWVGAGTAASVLAASGLDLLRPLSADAAVKAARARRTAAPPTQFDREVATLCEMCVWRCGVRAKVKDDRISSWKATPSTRIPTACSVHAARPASPPPTTPTGSRIPSSATASAAAANGGVSVGTRRWTTSPAQMLAIKNKYGAEAMVFSTTHNLVQTQFENLMQGVRVAQLRHAALALLQRHDRRQPADVWPGRTGPRLQPDPTTSSTPAATCWTAISNSETQALVAAIARGAKVVVLDPRFTKTAAKATEWLPIKPGTDLAFHLALLQEIIEQRPLRQAVSSTSTPSALRRSSKPVATTRPNGRPASAKSPPRPSGASPLNSR